MDIVLATIALYFIVNWTDFFYTQPQLANELKKVIDEGNTKYADFLHW